MNKRVHNNCLTVLKIFNKTKGDPLNLSIKISQIKEEQKGKMFYNRNKFFITHTDISYRFYLVTMYKKEGYWPEIIINIQICARVYF